MSSILTTVQRKVFLLFLKRAPTLVLLTAMLTLSSVALSAEYQLFNIYGNTHVPHRKYDGFVSKLRPGDSIKFSNQAAFTIDRILGAGATTLVLAIKEHPDLALRIPLNQNAIPFLNSYAEGEKLLRSKDVPSVNVFDHYPFEYILVKKISGRTMSFHDFSRRLMQSNTRISVHNHLFPWSKIPLAEMSDHFVDFAKRISHFGQIGDLHPGNLIYSFETKEWLILDWTKSHRLAVSLNQYRYQATTEVPFRLLLDDLGEIQGRGTQFRPYRDSKDEKLKDTINRALHVIATERQRIHGKLSCQGVFLDLAHLHL